MDSLLPLLPMLSHLLIGFFFVFFGFWNIYHWSPIVEVMIQKRIPAPWLMLAIGITWQILAGFLIIFGAFIKLAALSLIPFTIISVFMFHPFWKHRGEQRALNLTIFVANLTITVGALLLLINNISPMANPAEFLICWK